MTFIDYKINSQSTDDCVKSGSPSNNSPLTLSVTVTLNLYCCLSCSPGTSPEEALAGKVTAPLSPSAEE